MLKSSFRLLSLCAAIFSFLTLDSLLAIGDEGEDREYQTECKEIARNKIIPYAPIEATKACSGITDEYKLNCVRTFSNWFGSGPYYSTVSMCQHVKDDFQVQCIHEDLNYFAEVDARKVIAACTNTEYPSPQLETNQNNNAPARPMKAADICKTIRTAKETNQCLKVASRGYFQENALQVCNRYSRASSTIQCLKLIKHDWFDDAALAVCDTYTDANMTTKCLKIIKSRAFDQAAVEACDQFISAKDTNKCLKKIRGRWRLNKP